MSFLFIFAPHISWMNGSASGANGSVGREPSAVISMSMPSSAKALTMPATVAVFLPKRLMSGMTSSSAFLFFMSVRMLSITDAIFSDGSLVKAEPTMRYPFSLQ